VLWGKDEGTRREPGSDRWVRVRLLPGRVYAEQMQDILAQEGIPSMLQSDDVGVCGPGGGAGSNVLGVYLCVPGRFEARAREIVEAYLDGL